MTRERKCALTGVCGMICNIGLGLTKLVIGFVTSSVSIMSDAVNNLSDAGSSFMAVMSFILAGKCADRDHPNGHGRYEYVASLIIGILIITVGAQFAISSIGKIINPEVVKFDTVLMWILICSLVVKLGMGFFYLRVGKALNATSLKAASVDSFFDCIVTTSVIIGFVLSPLMSFPIDGVMGLLVSVIIVYGGFKIMLAIINTLLGHAADAKLVEEVHSIIKSHPLVVGTHDLKVHDYGPNKTMGSIHAEFDKNISIYTAHKIIDECERRAKTELDIELVIHCDPIDLKDVLASRVRHLIKDIIRNFGGISAHDITVDEENKAVEYHLTVLECQRKNEKFVTECINQEIRNDLADYQIKVVVDYE